MSDWSRHYVKLCDVADFTDPRLCAAMAEIEGRLTIPGTLIERKQWERAMLARVLTERGCLRDDCCVLAIGAGSEPILFWLANRVGRVVATDIYGDGKFAAVEADESMLSDPASFAPVPYRQDHLEVRHMDARHLEFGDETFDVVYSLSSIEHFGTPQEIAGAAAEMGRVLKPGGVAVVVTESLVRLHPLDRAPAEFAFRLASLGKRRQSASMRRRSALAEAFTAEELQSYLIGPSGLRLVQPLDLTLSPASWDNVTRVLPDGGREPATGNPYPHVLLQIQRSVFTSVCLVLEKPGAT